MEQFYLLPDTNFWVYETLLLRTPLAGALLHAMVQADSHVLLPEVVSEEVRQTTQRYCDELSQEIRERSRILGTLAGYSQTYTIPPHGNAADQRFTELADRTLIAPLSESASRGALQRAVRRSAPSGAHGHQFRDCLIWEAAMEAAAARPVILVSKDKVFYREGGYDKGMEAQLADEVKSLAHPILLYSNAAECLTAVSAGAPGKTDAYVPMINAIVKPMLTGMADEKGFKVHELIETQIDAFITEDHNRLAANFALTYRVTLSQEKVALHQLASAAGFAVVEGDCTIELNTKKASNVDLQTVKFLDETKSKSAGGIIYMRTSRSLATPLLRPYTYRQRLEG